MMKYRDIEYTVVQGIGRHLWKWSASVADPEWQAAIEGLMLVAEGQRCLRELAS